MCEFALQRLITAAVSTSIVLSLPSEAIQRLALVEWWRVLERELIHLERSSTRPVDLRTFKMLIKVINPLVGTSIANLRHAVGVR